MTDEERRMTLILRGARKIVLFIAKPSGFCFDTIKMVCFTTLGRSGMGNPCGNLVFGSLPHLPLTLDSRESNNLRNSYQIEILFECVRFQRGPLQRRIMVEFPSNVSGIFFAFVKFSKFRMTGKKPNPVTEKDSFTENSFISFERSC